MSKSTQVNGKVTATLGQLIEDATVQDCEKSSVMQICDIINSSDDGPREAVKCIRKSFATRNPSVIKLTLVLLEDCVRNCEMRFCVQIASREFLEDFLKILKPKYNHSMELQTTVLGLLQSWALSFENIPELKEINKTYQDLKNKNVEFPPIDPDKLMELNIPTKFTESSDATDLLLPEGGQMHSLILLPTGAGQKTPRRSSAGVVRSGLSPTGTDTREVRRPSAATIQSYLLPTGTEFLNSRRSSAASTLSMRRASADMIHHSCLSPTGTDTEKSRRRPSADLFHPHSLAPAGTDNEKTRRRNSRDIVHNSSLSPAGIDSEKARRRPSTDMVQLPCLSPTGTDSNQTRRRLSTQNQSRCVSLESLYRRVSLQSQNRRASYENRSRLPFIQSEYASQLCELLPVSPSRPTTQSSVEEVVTAVGSKGHSEKVATVSTKTAESDFVVNNLVDLNGSPLTGATSKPPAVITKQRVDITLDGSSMKTNSPSDPCIVVTTIDEEVIFDRDEDTGEMEQWVTEKQ